MRSILILEDECRLTAFFYRVPALPGNGALRAAAADEGHA
jgi:hypothetical protein